MADELLSASDLVAAKKHDTFHSEVITGKTGGVSTGADIDYATNAVTGQVQKTMPKILDDLDWSYVGLFADGVTFTDKTDFAVDADGVQWIYTGSFPFSATAGTIPSEPTYQAVHVRDHNSSSNRNAPGAHDAIYNRKFASVSECLSYSGHELGNVYGVEDYYGGSTPSGSGMLFFKVVAAGTGVADGGKYIDIDENFQLQQNLKRPYDVMAWGAYGNDVNDDYTAIQATIDYAMSQPKGNAIKTPLNHYCSQPLTIGDLGARSALLSFIGDGFSSSGIRFDNAITTAITSRNIEFVDFNNMYLNGGGCDVLLDIKKRDDVADLDFVFNMCRVVNATTLVKAAGRGVVFRGGIVGLCTTALDIESIEDLPDLNSQQHAFRHYTFEGVRTDSVGTLINTPSTGDCAQYISDVQIIGCDMYKTDKLLSIGGRVIGLTVVGNTAIDSFINNIITGGSLWRATVEGNTFQNEWDNSAIKNAGDPIPRILDLAAGSDSEDISIIGNTIRGISEQAVRSLGATRNLKINGNTFTDIWEYDTGSSSRFLLFGAGNDVDFEIKNNTLSAKFPHSVTLRRYVDETVYPPQVCNIDGNDETGISLRTYRGSYQPPINIGGSNHGSYNVRDSYYYRDGDYLYGTVKIVATSLPGALTGSVGFGLPVVSISDNASSSWSGTAEVISVSGVSLAAGESITLCRLAGQVGVLRVSGQSGIRDLLHSDLTGTLDIEVKFKFRFK